MSLCISVEDLVVDCSNHLLKEIAGFIDSYSHRLNTIIRLMEPESTAEMEYCNGLKRAQNLFTEEKMKFIGRIREYLDSDDNPT